MKTCMFSCFHVHVFMSFLQLVPTFPHDIIVEKGPICQSVVITSYLHHNYVTQ